MYLNNLSDKIWATKNARFTAYKRMKRNRISSMASVALLSASIIAVNMLAFLDVSENGKNYVTIVTIILSTFALVMSLLISLLRYESRETNYHQCGIELDGLNQKIQIRLEGLEFSNNDQDGCMVPSEDNEAFLEEYVRILKKYDLNHTQFDYQYAKWVATGGTQCCWVKIYYWFRWNIWDVNMLYWLIALLPMATVLYILANELLKKI